MPISNIKLNLSEMMEILWEEKRKSEWIFFLFLFDGPFLSYYFMKNDNECDWDID